MWIATGSSSRTLCVCGHTSTYGKSADGTIKDGAYRQRRSVGCNWICWVGAHVVLICGVVGGGGGGIIIIIIAIGFGSDNNIIII